MNDRCDRAEYGMSASLSSCGRMVSAGIRMASGPEPRASAETKSLENEDGLSSTYLMLSGCGSVLLIRATYWLKVSAGNVPQTVMGGRAELDEPPLYVAKAM